jgi:hypothetical protein
MQKVMRVLLYSNNFNLIKTLDSFTYLDIVNNQENLFKKLSSEYHFLILDNAINHELNIDFEAFSNLIMQCKNTYSNGQLILFGNYEEIKPILIKNNSIDDFLINPSSADILQLKLNFLAKKSYWKQENKIFTTSDKIINILQSKIEIYLNRIDVYLQDISQSGLPIGDVPASLLVNLLHIKVISNLITIYLMKEISLDVYMKILNDTTEVLDLYEIKYNIDYSNFEFLTMCHAIRKLVVFAIILILLSCVVLTSDIKIGINICENQINITVNNPSLLNGTLFTHMILYNLAENYHIFKITNEKITIDLADDKNIKTRSI